MEGAEVDRYDEVLLPILSARALDFSFLATPKYDVAALEIRPILQLVVNYFHCLVCRDVRVRECVKGVRVLDVTGLAL